MFPREGIAPFRGSLLFRALLFSMLLHAAFLFSQSVPGSFRLTGERRIPAKIAPRQQTVSQPEAVPSAPPGATTAARVLAASQSRSRLARPEPATKSAETVSAPQASAPFEDVVPLTPEQGRAMRAFRIAMAERVAVALPAALPAFEATVSVRYASNGTVLGIDFDAGDRGAREWLKAAFAAAANVLPLPQELNGRAIVLEFPVSWQPDEASGN